MNTCRLIDFMQAIKPWLNENYIHQARLDECRNFTLTFVDGGQKAYSIDDCSAAQLDDIIGLMKENGVKVM
jgi:hypothetical protein